MRTSTVALAAIVALGRSIKHTNAFTPTHHNFIFQSNRAAALSNSRLRMTTDTTDNQSKIEVSQLIPFSDVTYEFENMTNDGPFAWMVFYLNLIGYKKGKTLVGAVPTKPTSKMSDEEALSMRNKAAEELTNIGPEERERRAKNGTILLSVSAIYAVLSALFLDDGTILGHLAKFAVAAPLFLGRGYQLSAQSGL